MAAPNSKALDPAFQGVGRKVGVSVWRIENSDAVPVPELQHGKFASPRSYIVLNTRAALDTGAGLQHNVHYWLGASTNNSDATSAAVKAVELGASLGGHGVVLYREVEGYETDRFLAYFKPCFIPIRAGSASAASWSKSCAEAVHQDRLFVCKGRHVLRVKEVPFARSSLTHDNVFILDTESKIFQFNGASTDIYQRAKALDVVQYLQKNFHTQPCPVAIVEDGRFVADADSGDFWGLFGGFDPLEKSPNHQVDVKSESTKMTLFCINEGRQTAIERASFERAILSTSKCYILDCGRMWFTWAGRDTLLEEQKAVVLRAEAMIAKSKYPHRIHLACVIEGFEPTEFKLNFESWPICAELPTFQGGRGKVSGFMKRKDVSVQDVDSAKQRYSAINSTGKLQELQVWCIHKATKQSVSASDHGRFVNNNAYIVLYTDATNRKDKHFIFLWFGNQTIMETKKNASEYSKDLVSSLKGSMVEVLVFEGKEPDLFLSHFAKLVIEKGDKRRGSSSLYQVKCSSPSNCQAIELPPVAASLNSSGCFILHVNTTVFTWYGNLSTVEEHEAAEKIVLNLKPGVTSITVREGFEPKLFWDSLGGKKFYPSHGQPKDDTKDPHLFSCHFVEDKLEVEEVFNFTQEDLYSDEVMILNCFTYVFVWVGQKTNDKDKRMALHLGQQYLQQAAKHGHVSTNVPIYKIHEGDEPSFFTSFFEWDSSKSMCHRDPFQTKVRALNGKMANDTKSRQHLRVAEGKGFPSTDKVRFDSGVSAVSKPKELVQIPKNYTSNGSNYRATPRKLGSTVSVLSLAFELQNGGGAPPNTPIVKQSKLSLKSRDFRRKESPLGTPCSTTRTPMSATSRTPRTAVSPAIATLSSVFESYSDRFAFAWPGMQHRHEDRTRRGYFDLDSPVTVSETDPTEIPYRRSAMFDLDEQLLLQEIHHQPPQKSLQHRFQAALHSIADDDDEESEECRGSGNNDNDNRSSDAQAPLDADDDGNDAAADGDDNLTYPYERLKVSSANPVAQIDSSRREAYLSDGEFQDVFHMDKVTFYKLPKWKQDKYKVIKDLF